MRNRLLIFALVATFAIGIALAGAPVQADALHGFCTNVTCNDNGAITPVPSSNPTFGFWAASGPESGTDYIVIVSPTNLGSSLTINETNTGSATGTANLLGSQWTSGFLDAFLGLSAQPNNPFNNYGGPTGIDQGVSSFFVYELNLGTQTLQNQANELNGPLFSVQGGLPDGVFVLDFLDPPGTGTPNSAALLIQTPEPSSLGMLGMGLVGVLGFARRRIIA